MCGAEDACSASEGRVDLWVLEGKHSFPTQYIFPDHCMPVGLVPLHDGTPSELREHELIRCASAPRLRKKLIVFSFH